MKQINLYQAAFRPPSVVLPARKMLLSGAVFVFGLLLLYVWNNWQLRLLHDQVEQITRRAEAVMRQVDASAPGSTQSNPAVAAEAQKLEARIRALQLAQEAIANGEVGSETGYAAQFRSLARAAGNHSSPGAWLTGVALYDNGRALDLQGRTLSGAATADLIGNLRREPLFVGLSFAGLQVGAPEEKSGQSTAADNGKPPRYLVFTLNARQDAVVDSEAKAALAKAAALAGEQAGDAR